MKTLGNRTSDLHGTVRGVIRGNWGYEAHVHLYTVRVGESLRCIPGGGGLLTHRDPPCPGSGGGVTFLRTVSWAGWEETGRTASGPRREGVKSDACQGFRGLSNKEPALPLPGCGAERRLGCSGPSIC